VPPEWPAQTLVWMCTPDADDYLGADVMLRDDAVVSSSPRDETPPAANLSSCFGLDLSGEHREGRWFAWAR
ncbi:MAG: hypothetical protein P8P85_11055, partial [Acidimicrobiales bacterium]|nr:hypothetical protein [Acidimicrobiales bacterium]